MNIHVDIYLDLYINYSITLTLFLCRRTADVRSVGYSELFVLSRQDVLSALKDHPEAEVGHVTTNQPIITLHTISAICHHCH